MRPQRSIVVASRAALAALSLSGCAPDAPPADVEVLPPGPSPSSEPVQAGQLNPIEQLNQIQVDRESRSGPEPPPPPPAPRRLVFECAGGITFAVRMRGGGVLDLYPPNTPGGYLPLSVVPSASGVHYRIADIDFFSKGDVATLQMGRERYVDCVANPAASTWQDPEPRTGPLR
jgi:membrane-bound inhibitor of C-type lysozyme